VLGHHLSSVLVHGTEGRGVFLLAFGDQTIRTETGMPSPVIRLRTLHPTLASVP
jgi:hypothetical protein